MNHNHFIDGLHLLQMLGSIIEDTGSSENGQIFISDVDYPKYKLIQSILDFMDTNLVFEPPYRFLYRYEFYTENEVPPHYNLYNSYVYGMIIDQKKLKSIHLNN